MLLGKHAAITQIAHEVGHKERVAFGLGMNQRGQFSREAMFREFEREILFDL